MRREQLGELVDLTSHLPAPRRTEEMPAVELVDLLRRDRELDAAPAGADAHLHTPAHHQACAQDDPAAPSPGPAAGIARLRSPSRVKLVLGCAAAFLGGLALTLPLWW